MIKTLKALSLLVFLGTGKIASAQTTFYYHNDFKKILAQTKDPNDKLYYENQLKRFSANDASLSDFEVLALLIGYTDKKDYKPYADLETEREVYRINDEGEFKKGLKEANKFLATHPFSIKVLFEKSYSYYKLGNEDSAAYYSSQAKRIFMAMDYSGDGRSSETPMFALGPADGQEYIRKYLGAGIGTMGSGRDKNGDFLDMLTVMPDDGSASYRMNFIIQHATDKMFSEEEKKDMEDAMKDMEKKENKKKSKE